MVSSKKLLCAGILIACAFKAKIPTALAQVVSGELSAKQALDWYDARMADGSLTMPAIAAGSAIYFLGSPLPGKTVRRRKQKMRTVYKTRKGKK